MREKDEWEAKGLINHSSCERKAARECEVKGREGKHGINVRKPYLGSMHLCGTRTWALARSHTSPSR